MFHRQEIGNHQSPSKTARAGSIAFWLWALAQVCLLQNWFAGLSGVIGFGTLYAFRIGREERLMRETFGPVWDAYVARSWRLLPLLH